MQGQPGPIEVNGLERPQSLVCACSAGGHQLGLPLSLDLAFGIYPQSRKPSTSDLDTGLAKPCTSARSRWMWGCLHPTLQLLDSVKRPGRGTDLPASLQVGPLDLSSWCEVGAGPATAQVYNTLVPSWPLNHGHSLQAPCAPVHRHLICAQA